LPKQVPQFSTNLTAHKPSDSDSDYGPGRSFLDKAEKSAEVSYFASRCHPHSIPADEAQREAKFDTYSQVFFKTHTASGGRAHVMTVKARRKIAKTYKRTTYVSYEYQLEDTANQLYEKGAWIPEKQLESCDGS